MKKTIISDLTLITNKEFKILFKIVNIILVILSTYATVFCVFNTHNLIRNFNIYVILLCLISIYFAVMFQIRKYVIIEIIIYMIAMIKCNDSLVLGIRLIYNVVVKNINEKSDYVFDLIKVSNHYISSDEKNGYILTVILFFTIFISYIVSYAIVKKRSLLLLVLFTFPFIEINIFFAVVPKVLDFIILILSYIALVSINISTQKIKNKKVPEFIKNRKEYFYQGKFLNKYFLSNSIFGVFVTIVCILFILIIFPEDIYDNSKDLEDLKNNIKTMAGDFFTDVKEYVFEEASGGINDGKLGNVDALKYNNSIALKIKSNFKANEKIYLKGFVGVEYTGDSWKQLSKQEYEQYKDIVESIENNAQNLDANLISMYLSDGLFGDGLLDFLALSQINPNSNMYLNYVFSISYADIEIVNANKKYKYVPYGTIFTSNNNEDFFRDSYIKGKVNNTKYDYVFFDINKQENYNEDYESELINFTNTSNDLQEKIIEYKEKLVDYENYVYKVYTKLPENTFNDIIIKCNKYKKKYKTLKETISDIKKYLATNYEYTLSPGKLPAGKDFVNYFLYENKKGYCTYFASSATIILRALGIPARYVEGYVVEASNINGSESKDILVDIEGKNYKYTVDNLYNIDVIDKNAHAWVEIYNDGKWIPVDFTPAIGDNILNNNLSEKIESTSETGVLSSEKTTSQDVTETTTEKSTEINKENDNIIKEDIHKNIELKKIILKILEIILSIFILIIFAKIVYKVLKHSKSKKYLDMTPKEKVLYDYNFIVDLLLIENIDVKNIKSYDDLSKKLENEYIKKDDAKKIFDIYLKAKFSNQQIIDEDLEYLRNIRKDILKEVLSNSSGITKLKLKIKQNI